MPLQEQEFITASDNEQVLLKKIESMLHEIQQVPRLIDPYGEEIELPVSLFHVLRQTIYHLSQGQTISIMPVNKEVSTQEAADFLNVSRPFLVKLLEQGDIPFIKVGTHRRIHLKDLLTYKTQRDATRQHALTEISRISDDEGIYD